MLLYDKKNDRFLFACEPEKLSDLINRIVFEHEDIHSEFVYPALVALGVELRRGVNYNNFNIKEKKNESS